MVVVQASKINLPTPSSLYYPQTTSFLFEPHSLSLALMHSDSSFSLFSSLSFPLLSLPQALTIPSPSSSSSFLLLQETQEDPNPRVLFIVGGPHKGTSKVLLRFYLLRNNESKVFDRAKVVSKQKGIDFDDKVGVLLDVNHGMKISIVGSVNFFALYSLSDAKVLIFGVKLVGDDDAVAVKLMRCAVIECCRPVFSMSISFGWLILGEENGVRVIDLRGLVKGKTRRVKNLASKEKLLNVSNSLIRDGDDFGGSSSEIPCNGSLDGKIEKHCVSAKLRSIKYIQETDESGACFVAFKEKEVKGLESTALPKMSVKTISIQALSPKKFLILDSSGELCILNVHKTAVGFNISCQLRQLPQSLKVQKLAVFPEMSSRIQTIWISDGYQSVQMMDIDTTYNEDDGSESEGKLMQTSVSQAIFTSEKVQDMIPTAAKSILILGQARSLYAYAVS
ncbi:hypothetical protein SLEP1_g27412 [Rubroshorea leprosula]|uniref:Uncharacterized protein n=1 Tax=Rubroshorea leprosula TaxID=152421 RepID=A0AAV5JVW3_9ROSI|nr:hypothetical protein SLEP1_g27412 [Rubroshorea leprosula]